MTQQTNGIPGVDQQGKRDRPLPEIVDVASMMGVEIEEPPVLIEGLLHAGSKMVIGGNSKSFKTFSMINLGLCVAAGEEWLNLKTYPGRVLYLNLEIQSAFMLKRCKTVAEKLKIKLEPGEVDAWNLRGHAADLTLLVKKMLPMLKEKGYKLIILDPIYKVLGNRDENKAGDITSLMNDIELLAEETGAAVVFGAHFSKGNQAAKESIDRIGGSGVYARDPDTIMIMTRHEEENAFVVETTLRNFPPMPPFCIRWEYPLMVRDVELNPEDIKATSGRSAKVPTDAEFVAIFPPDWPEREPLRGLFTNSQLAWEFKQRKFDKNALVACRDKAEAEGTIKVVRNIPRNQVLAGLPGAVDAFEQTRARAEKPVSKCRQTRTSRNQFSSPPGGLEN